MVMMMKKAIKIILFIFLCFFIITPKAAYASVPSINVDVGTTDDPAAVAASVQILFLISIIVLAPSLLMMVTCFPRILICFHFVRAALGTQQMPPNQILVALALFITFAFMGNTITTINDTALKPLANAEISMETAFTRGMAPIREFMLRNVADRDVALFWELSGEESFNSILDTPNKILIPAFLLGEITKGFQFGVYVYIPFIVIDMVVASILMAMGMMMLPPAMISLPFKILLFVSVGGWNLTIQKIIESIR